MSPWSPKGTFLQAQTKLSKDIQGLQGSVARFINHACSKPTAEIKFRCVPSNVQGTSHSWFAAGSVMFSSCVFVLELVCSNDFMKK